MLHKHVARIPKYKGHGTAGLRVPRLRSIPRIAVSVDASRSESVDMDPLTTNDKPGGVVLKGNGIGVAAPVTQVVRQLVCVTG